MLNDLIAFGHLVLAIEMYLLIFAPIFLLVYMIRMFRTFRRIAYAVEFLADVAASVPMRLFDAPLSDFKKRAESIVPRTIPR